MTDAMPPPALNGAARVGRVDPLCPVCSEPIRSGMLRQHDGGAFYHAYCRTRQLQRAALEQFRHAAPAQADAPPLIETTTQPTGDVRPSDGPAQRRGCPVCSQLATVTDWGPTWLVIDGCRCSRFFVARETLEWRLARLGPAERAELAATILGFRAMGREAWVTTSDGTGISGRLVILTESPEPSS
jgi:hypothetical protein